MLKDEPVLAELKRLAEAAPRKAEGRPDGQADAYSGPLGNAVKHL
jgi:hypothetical protein